MKIMRLILALAVAAAMLPASLPAAAQDDRPDLTLFLGFIPNIQFAPVYVALEKGYFATEAGVDITLEYGDENLGAERIAAGELRFGIFSGEQVLLARYGGRPLVYVYEWYRRYPVAVAALADSGIAGVDDLRGRAVGVPGRFGASYVGLRALLAAAGLTEDDIRLEEIGYNAPALLCAGRVEAAVVYIANEPAQIARECGAVNVIELPPEADLVGNGLITNEATIAGEPELVRGMVRALARGIADTLASPDEAFEISRRYVETLPRGGGRIALALAAAEAVDSLRSAGAGEGLSAAEAGALAESLSAALNPDEVTQMQVLLNSIRLWEGPPPGMTDPVSWEATMNTLIAAGLLPGPLNLSEAYTHDFLP